MFSGTNAWSDVEAWSVVKRGVTWTRGVTWKSGRFSAALEATTDAGYSPRGRLSHPPCHSEGRSLAEESAFAGVSTSAAKEPQPK
jgi:hypothetical protein